MTDDVSRPNCAQMYSGSPYSSSMIVQGRPQHQEGLRRAPIGRAIGGLIGVVDGQAGAIVLQHAAHHLADAPAVEPFSLDGLAQFASGRCSTAASAGSRSAPLR